MWKGARRTDKAKDPKTTPLRQRRKKRRIDEKRWGEMGGSRNKRDPREASPSHPIITRINTIERNIRKGRKNKKRGKKKRGEINERVKERTGVFRTFGMWWRGEMGPRISLLSPVVETNAITMCDPAQENATRIHACPMQARATTGNLEEQ